MQQWVWLKMKILKSSKGEDKLKLYQFHTKVAKHYFCSRVWNLYLHHHPRSTPAMTGFNLGCVDEVNDVARFKRYHFDRWPKSSNGSKKIISSNESY